ncbi:MAG: DegQ family serine endoprotease [Steroidobacteraceae bacterium]
MTHRHFRPTHLACRLFASVAALLLITGAPAMAQLPAQVGNTAMPSLAPIIKRTSPAVVGISVKGTQQQQRNPLLQDPFFRRFFDVPDQQMEREFQASGSGVIVDAKQGYIITNAHVVENAKDITVTLLDNRKLTATVKGVDSQTDIAVLQVKDNNLTAMVIADSSNLQVGDFVIAIGNPFGLEHTVTSGIVSALGRATGMNQDSYEDLIQTDAAINPGNSGGALIDLNGQLVGINSSIFSNNGGNMGIGFAIPSSMAKSVMDQLVKFGKVQRGLLGVSITDLTADIAASQGANESQGAFVSEVSEDSAAEKAGIKPGDIITAINSKQVKSASALKAAIGILRVGEKVEVSLVRDGKPRKVTATIAENADSTQIAATGKNGGKGNAMHEGLSGAQLSNNTGGGVLITDVAARSNAAQNGLQPNDVITAVGRTRIKNIKELAEATKDLNAFTLMIQRGNRTLFAVIR